MSVSFVGETVESENRYCKRGGSVFIPEGEPPALLSSIPRLDAGAIRLQRLVLDGVEDNVGLRRQLLDAVERFLQERLARRDQQREVFRRSALAQLFFKALANLLVCKISHDPSWNPVLAHPDHSLPKTRTALAAAANTAARAVVAPAAALRAPHPLSPLQNQTSARTTREPTRSTRGPTSSVRTRGES